MAKGVRVAAVVAALGMGLLGAVGAARADATDGEYAFTYASTSANSMTASGVFDLSGTHITTVIGGFADTSSFSRPVAFNFNSVLFGDLFSFVGNLYTFNAGFTNGLYDPISNAQGEEMQGFLSQVNNTFSGNIVVTDLDNHHSSSGLFTTTLQNFLNPVSPGSGGSTGGSGGTGTGGAGASGNAPSPEVNTLLGFLVVGGTVAFLKRRRKGGGTEGMATA